MKIPFAVTATLAIIAVSCAKPEPIRIRAVAPDDGAPPAAVEASAMTAARPWYAAKLEALGFYVFPAPEELPPFSVKALDGTDSGVQATAGRVTLLNFWATWCPPCRAEMPSIQALYEKTRDVAFTVMAISVNERKNTVTAFLKDNPFTFPVYLDESGAASAPFASRGIPTSFILDKQGRAIAGIVGSRMYDGPETVSLIRELAARLP